MIIYVYLHRSVGIIPYNLVAFVEIKRNSIRRGGTVYTNTRLFYGFITLSVVFFFCTEFSKIYVFSSLTDHVNLRLFQEMNVGQEGRYIFNKKKVGLVTKMKWLIFKLFSTEIHEIVHRPLFISQISVETRSPGINLFFFLFTHNSILESLTYRLMCRIEFHLVVVERGSSGYYKLDDKLNLRSIPPS